LSCRGCSTESAPSLSKTAMRSGTGVKSGEPAVVTRFTKSMIAALAATSFHDERGSFGAMAGATAKKTVAIANGPRRADLRSREYASIRCPPSEHPGAVHRFAKRTRLLPGVGPEEFPKFSRNLPKLLTRHGRGWMVVGRRIC